MGSSDRELVRRSCNGDADAFGELYGRYSEGMFRYAYVITGNYHAAEDAVSEAFTSAYKQIKSLRNPDSFKGWLTKIVKINANNQFNDLVSHGQLDVEYDASNQDDGGIGNMELSIELRTALKVLGTDERTIVYMKVFDGYRSREIAEIMDMPAATVRSKYKRAIDKLRKELTENKEGGEDNE